MQNLLGQIDITTDSVAMEILSLDKQPLTEDEALKPKISFFGVDSDVFRKAIKDNDEKDSDSGHKLIASCVESWVNIKTDEGQPIECNYDNALKLMKRYPVIFSQADSFVASRSNYLKKISGN